MYGSVGCHEAVQASDKTNSTYVEDRFLSTNAFRQTCDRWRLEHGQRDGRRWDNIVIRWLDRRKVKAFASGFRCSALGQALPDFPLTCRPRAALE